MKNNFPCKCGHFNSDHLNRMFGPSLCLECSNGLVWTQIEAYNSIAFHPFEPDNLKYLEMKCETLTSFNNEIIP